MQSLKINDLDEALMGRLRVRASAHHRSIEDEARQILLDALPARADPGPDLGTRIRSRFAPFGGVELTLQVRETVRSWQRPGDFTDETPQACPTPTPSDRS